MQNSRTITKKSPDSIPKPDFLQKIQWIFDPVSYMESAVSVNADICAAKVGGFSRELILVQHPQGIQQIFTNNKTFSAPGKYNEILRPLLGDYSVIMLEGDRHRRERKLLMPSFHGEKMQAYGELIIKLAEKVIGKIPIGQIFSARKAMQEISLQVILEAVFGLYEGERCQELKQLLFSWSDIFRSPFTSAFLFFRFLQTDLGGWSPWGKFLQQQQKIDELLYREIAERREKSHSQNNDILSLLMSARDEEGNPMTDKELRDELWTLMIAGHETTATSMSWALYWIHRFPEVKEKLLQELDSSGESLDPMAIARLPYLNAICNETLRISPVAILTFPRMVEEPVELMGWELEPGTLVVGCIYLTHYREDIYPDPKQFKPERFLERQFSPYEFLPFGGGSRRCIGEALAQFEMKLVLATILSRYHLVAADNRPERLRRRGITLGPANGVKMVITDKRPRPEKQAVLSGVV